MRRFGLLLLCLWLAGASPAWAGVIMTFYSREMGSTFPHTFFTLKGAPDAGGAAVDANFGFTAKDLTPAILMGSVAGKVITHDADYIGKSTAHFSIAITDDQYAKVMAVVEKWRSLPRPSYHLNKRNCVFFVGDAARAAGLSADDVPGLMKKPRLFVEHIQRMNTQAIAARQLAPRAPPRSERDTPVVQAGLGPQ